MHLRPWFLATVLAATASLLACGGGAASSPTAIPAATAPAASTPSAAPSPLPAPLARMLADVAGIRNLPPPESLRIETVSRKDVRALLDSLLTSEDRAYYTSTTTLYRLLGHLRADEDLLTVSSEFSGEAVLGLYSPPHKTLWVVTDGSTLDIDALSKQEKATLAHELLHALQDAHFNLDQAYRNVVGDLDRNLAWTAVVEGDAAIHEQAYTQRFLALPVGRAPGPMLLVTAASVRASIPPSIEREVYFPYRDGASAMRAVRDNKGTAGIDALLASPPAGTSCILHAERLTSGCTALPVNLPDLASTLGRDWKRESGGQFGEFQLRNYLQLRLAAGESVSAAARWTGDHYDVYVSGSASVAVFRVRFADASAAQAFVTAREILIRRSQPQVQGEIAQVSGGTFTGALPVVGDTVTFGVASSRDALTRVLDALRHG